MLLAVLRIRRTQRHQASFYSKMQRSYICRTCIWPSLILKWSNVESEWGAGRELTHSTLNRGHSGNRMFCFEDVSDRGVSYATSSCRSMALGACVGQIASSKHLASQFIMVVTIHLRAAARGAGQAKRLEIQPWKGDEMVFYPDKMRNWTQTYCQPFKSSSQSMGRLEK